MYQIKSTPYFQRIVKKSKRNGQLQMLKKEFERTDLLDERKIEMKMREVRLTKLKKEIEKIKRFNTMTHRLNSNDLRKTKIDQRMENIKNARKLGQYFSQRNMEEADAEATVKLNSQFLKKGIETIESLVSKRIKYGNEISKCNLQNLHLTKLRKEVDSNKNIKTKQISETSFRKAQTQMILNTNSSKNHRIKTSLTIKNVLTKSRGFIDFQIDSNDISSVLALSENVNFIDLETIDAEHSEKSEK